MILMKFDIDDPVHKKRLLIFLIFIIIIGGLAITLFIPIVYFLNPKYGGFNRNVIYVKGNQEQNGYFIIIDDIHTLKQDISVESVLHGLGTLEMADNTCLWTINDVKLNTTIIYPFETTITEHSGYYAELEKYIPYVKIKPPLGTERIITLLYPYNSTIEMPNISINQTKDNTDNTLVDLKIGSDDNWIFHTTYCENNHGCFSNENVSFSGDSCFYRFYNNGTIDTILSYNTLNLDFTDTTSAFEIEIDPAQDGDSYRTSYWKSFFNNNESIVASQMSQYSPAEYEAWQLSTSQIGSRIKSLDHPCLYFDEVNKSGIVNRINNYEPWKSWYENITSIMLDPNNFEVGDHERLNRSEYALNFAFIGYMENNQTLVDASKEFLLRMDEVENDYEKHLIRSYACYNYAFALDLIWNDISSADREIILDKLDDHTRKLYTKMDSSSENNWRVVMSCGLAMAGVMLENADYVQKADEQIDWYLQDKTLAEGGIFEGQGYGAYTWIHGLRVVYLLNKLGIRDYLEDPRFINTLKFMINCSTPNGYYPLFEDSGSNLNHPENMVAFAPMVKNSGYTELASNMQWLGNFNELINVTRFVAPRICVYQYNVTSTSPEIGVNNSVVFPQSGLVAFRDNHALGSNSTYLAMTCKNYEQSHDHKDENSFELYAYGEKILTNPGYPGWEYPHHKNWTITTEASNTYLFKEDGQQREDASGFEEWIIQENLNYIRGIGTELYVSDNGFLENVDLQYYYIGIIGITVSTSVIFYWLKKRWQDIIRT
ncbi:MAG: hypothetical protein GF364_07565 [Candidatus Lokiarchaeota archaeon]|nr:hypothetical protein [Candidatus Lokiarchaeota archaeon]